MFFLFACFREEQVWDAFLCTRWTDLWCLINWGADKVEESTRHTSGVSIIRLSRAWAPRQAIVSQPFLITYVFPKKKKKKSSGKN
jgi:hypothetical protein